MESDIPLQKKPSETSLNEIYKQIHLKSFRKKLKKYRKSGTDDIYLIIDIVTKLVKGETLDSKCRDHQLSGDMQHLRECHIRPDLLLIYFCLEEEKELHLVDVGSHSELFG
jgi:mRNA interferase YafQ